MKEKKSYKGCDKFLQFLAKIFKTILIKNVLRNSIFYGKLVKKVLKK